jgi:prepilin peptidase CpaA
MQQEQLLIILSVILVIIASLYDFALRKIPNTLILVSFVAILLIRVLGQGIESTFAALIQMLTIGLVLYPIYLFRWIGGGDIKLYMVLAFAFSASIFIDLFLLSLIAGGLMALCVLFLMLIKVILSYPSHRHIQSLRHFRFPYAGAIATGVLTTHWLSGALPGIAHG